MTEFEEKQLEILKSIEEKTEYVRDNTKGIYNNVQFFFWVFIISTVIWIIAALFSAFAATH